MRLVVTLAGLGGDFAKVYRDSEYQEFVVRFYAAGVYQKGATYHTDDKQDALDTGNSWLIAEDNKRRNR